MCYWKEYFLVEIIYLHFGHGETYQQRCGYATTMLQSS